MFNPSDWSGGLDLNYLLGVGTPSKKSAAIEDIPAPTIGGVPALEYNTPQGPRGYHSSNFQSDKSAKTNYAPQSGPDINRQNLYIQQQVFSDVKNGLQRRIDTESDAEQLNSHIATLQQQIALVKKYELRILDLLENPSIASDIKDKIFLAKTRAKTLFTRLSESGSIDMRTTVQEEQQRSCVERGKFQAILDSVLPDAEGFISSVDLYNQLKQEGHYLSNQPDNFAPMLAIIHLASEIESKQLERSVVTVSFYPTLKSAAVSHLKAAIPAMKQLSVAARVELESLRHDPSQTKEVLSKCRDAENTLSLYVDAAARIPFRKELHSEVVLLEREISYLSSTVASVLEEKRAEKNTAYLLAAGRGIAFGAGITIAIAVPTIGSSLLISTIQAIFSARR